MFVKIGAMISPTIFKNFSGIPSSPLLFAGLSCLIWLKTSVAVNWFKIETFETANL